MSEFEADKAAEVAAILFCVFLIQCPFIQFVGFLLRHPTFQCHCFYHTKDSYRKGTCANINFENVWIWTHS